MQDRAALASGRKGSGYLWILLLLVAVVHVPSLFHAFFIDDYVYVEQGPRSPLAQRGGDPDLADDGPVGQRGLVGAGRHAAVLPPDRTADLRPRSRAVGGEPLRVSPDQSAAAHGLHGADVALGPAALRDSGACPGGDSGLRAAPGAWRGGDVDIRPLRPAGLRVRAGIGAVVPEVEGRGGMGLGRPVGALLRRGPWVQGNRADPADRAGWHRGDVTT